MPRRAVSPGKTSVLPGEITPDHNSLKLTPGALYVVATPIGNELDVSYRAAYILQHVDVVIGESLGPLRRLLSSVESVAEAITSKSASCAGVMTAHLRGGGTAALVCDAGSPCIADPGLALITTARAAGFGVVSIPGPSAVTSALAICGISAQTFVFEGFPPRARADRAAFFAALGAEVRTIVLFETHRCLRSTLAELERSLGGARTAAVARNLTMADEEVSGGSLSDLAAHTRPSVRRGQYVIVVSGLRDSDNAS